LEAAAHASRQRFIGWVRPGKMGSAATMSSTSRRLHRVGAAACSCFVSHSRSSRVSVLGRWTQGGRPPCVGWMVGSRPRRHWEKKARSSPRFGEDPHALGSPVADPACVNAQAHRVLSRLSARQGQPGPNSMVREVSGCGISRMAEVAFHAAEARKRQRGPLVGHARYREGGRCSKTPVICRRTRRTVQWEKPGAFAPWSTPCGPRIALLETVAAGALDR